MIFSIIYRVIKYWLGGFLIFLIISMIIPEKKNFTDSTIYLDMPEVYNGIILPNTLYINKASKDINPLLSKWITEGNYERILIIVPRFEFFTYYFWLKENKILSHTVKYKMAARTTSYNLSYLIYNYHQTIIELISATTSLIGSFIRK